MFYPAGNFITVNGAQQHENLYPGAAYAFFDRLDTFLRDHPTYTLDIVGYSMGAIIANEALRNFPELRIRNLIYMGAACSIRDFNVVGGSYLTHSRSTQFYNLCLHPRAELDEANVGGVPVRGSLLTWIDEFFQTPESFGDRTLGTSENAVIAYQLLPQTKQIHLKAFGMNENQFGPQKHGEFCNFEFWNPRYWRTDVPLNASYRLLQ
jgi:pimeloyl-ACP methyl ester carboxylesterase